MVLKGLTGAMLALALSLPVALGATPARTAPGQRVDLKVLLISADGTEPGYGAWKAALDREGVPYETLQAYNGQARAQTLTDARLADYGANHARFQAVILAGGDLRHSVTNPNGTTSFLSALTDAEWTTLAKFERSFGIRRLSDYTAPSPAHGLSTVTTEGLQDGKVGTLTPAGRAAFPYLKGPVAIADDDPRLVPEAGEAYGYPATPDPANPGAWQTLLAGPPNTNTAYLGIYTPADGREEMVMTVASNQFQNHNQLLRHGMLNWVTRGVYLGYQRNYLELQVDDLFLGDDAWDELTNTTSYDPLRASRMTPADVDRAIEWSRARGLRLDMAYNGGGSALEGPGDPLTAKFADPAVRNAFGYVNHTLDHPNLDCSTTPFIRSQITSNLQWARAHGLPVDGAELVTGEHSGLANARPGNPGTIDPPSFADTPAPVATGGAIAAGTYDYAVTARSPRGETVASIVAGIVVGAAGSTTNAVDLSFNAVCHAVAYDVYRRSAGTGAWGRVTSIPTTPNAATDNGAEPITVNYRDTTTTPPAATPPASNGAALDPYGQNPQLLAALNQAGVRYIAADASKGYPSNPTVITSPLVPAGASFTQGAVRAFARYPSNVYYNVSRQGQQLDEYNWIYVAPANGGNCVPIAGVTTCRTTLATWPEYVASETRVMFRHLMDNDPRPHFFHQSNLADYNPALPVTDLAQGGILYPVIDALVDRYEAAFDRTGAPLLQLTSTQIAETLARQEAWMAARGSVSAWRQDGRVYVRNSGAAAVSVPLTGTTAGEPYGGQRAGWVSLAAGAEAAYAPAEPTNTALPALQALPALPERPRAGETLSVSDGTWTGTSPITFARQWQRCEGTRCVNIAGATDARYELTAADVGKTVRAAVLAGNWIASVSQAFSAPSAEIAPAPVETRSEQGQTTPERRVSPDSTPRRPAGRPAKLRLTKVKLSPRRFTVSHRRLPKGTRLDGTRVSWRLNRAATVRLTFQKHTRKGYKRVGVITRAAKAGAGEVRFRGRFGKRLLTPQRYRLVVTASGGGDRTGTRRLGFRVIKG